MNKKQQPSGCLGAILKVFGIQLDGSPSALSLPYVRKDYLLTRAERAFYEALTQAIGSRYLIFAKVRLADLLFMPKGVENRQSFQNRINAKHIDFVLCDHDAIRPILAIELDDTSHQRADRQARDNFVDQALLAAKLPILHVTVRASYDAGELREQIQTHALS